MTQTRSAFKAPIESSPSNSLQIMSARAERLGRDLRHRELSDTRCFTTACYRSNTTS
jgi:hypothetical protein